MSTGIQAPTPVKRYSSIFPTGQHNISDGDGVGPASGSFLEVFRYTHRKRPSASVLSCSMNTIPRSEGILRSLGVPIALGVSPLASMDNLRTVGLKSSSIPLIKAPPIRCQRCRGYMSPYNILLNESWTCVLCSRVNPYPSNRVPTLVFSSQANSFVPSIPADYNPDNIDTLPQAEFHCATVEYDVSANLAFLPATTDAAAALFSELNPGEVSHVQASVLSAEPIMEANAITVAAEQPLPSNESVQNRFEGNNIAVPSTECLYSRRLPVLNADELIANAISGSEKDSIRIPQEARPVCLPFNIIILIPITVNSINSGVLASSCTSILSSLQFIDQHVSITPLFYNKKIVCYRRINRNPERIEEVEIVADSLVSEPVIPYPLEELAMTRDVAKEQAFFQKLLSHFYSQAAASVSAGMECYTLSSMVSAIAGCVSTLQRTSGKVIAIQTDPVTRGMGCNPLSTINPVEYSNPSVEKLYLSRNMLVNRLAHAAASHNVGIDIIALPLDKNINLGLVPLSSLCVMTGGTLLYNEASVYAGKHSAGSTGLGNADFTSNALLRLLTAKQGISATLSIRTSEGLTVSMQEVTGESTSSSLSSALTASGASALWASTRGFIASTISKRSKDTSNSDEPSSSSQTFGAAKGRPPIENISQLIQAESKPRYKTSSADNFFANYFKVSDIEYSFANISEHTCYVMELKYNAKLPVECQNSYIQTALLYTNTDGSRRIRISTLQLAVSDNFTDIYSNIDQNTYMSWLAKKLAYLTLNSAALVTGDTGALGGRILLEKPVSDSGLDIEIEDGLIKYGNIIIGSAVSTTGDNLPMLLHGGGLAEGGLPSMLQTGQSMPSVVQSISNSLGLQGKRKTIDEGVRTGHVSANGAAYLLSKYAGLLTAKQLPLNIAASSLLFDGEYSYGAILKGRKMLEQMVYPLIKQFRDLSSNIASDRLTVPTNMDLVPFYLMGLTRTALCHSHRSENEGGPFTADMRCSAAFLALSASANSIASMLYPVIYNITTYLTSFVPEIEIYKTAHPEVTLTMPISIPTPMRACSRYIENLTGSVLYILSGNTSFFWVGSLVPEDIRRGLFGAQTHNELKVAPLSSYTSVSQNKGMLSTLLSLITAIKGLACCCGSDIVVPEGSGGVESLVRWMLVEDSTSQDKGYADFLNGFSAAISSMQ